ncbi:MAG: hypothetical protein AAF674_01870 [Pseudomonadota bacterium]
MPVQDAAKAALGILFKELEATLKWEREIRAEAAKAAGQRTNLTEAVRSSLRLLGEEARRQGRDRLAELTGEEFFVPRRVRSTARTELAKDWLATRDPPDFHISELRAHFQRRGIMTARAYLPTLVSRWAKAGLLTQIEHGRYRINHDHTAFVEEG